MHAEIPEVSLKFRIAPLFAILTLAVIAPFGLPFAVVGGIFAVGLLGLCALLGLPKSTDFMFGLVLAMIVFAAQFLGGVFLGIEAGGSTTSMVFTTGVIWFLQLGAIATDLHLYGTPIVQREATASASSGRRKPRRQTLVTAEMHRAATGTLSRN
ncbi:MAG: hypothetical protein MK085_03870 [Phycisphaerales bacterium]|nr:hypothetical protein [Phycisphaerales bacterium]